MVPEGGWPASAEMVGIRLPFGGRGDLVPGAARPIPWPGAPREGVGRTWGCGGGRVDFTSIPPGMETALTPPKSGRRGQAGTAVPPTPEPEPPPRLFSNTSPRDWQEQHVMCLLIRVRGGERGSERAGEQAGRGAEAGAGTAAGVPGSPAPRPPPSLWEKRRRGSDYGVDELCTSRNAILIPFPEQVCISPRSLPKAHRSPRHHAREPSALPCRKYAPGVPALGTRVAARCLGPSWERPSEELLGMGRVKSAERVVVF